MEGHREQFEHWLLETAVRLNTVPDLLDSFCKFLNKQGFEIRRCNLGGDTIHPMMNNIRFIWFDRMTDPGPFPPSMVVARRQRKFGKAMVDELHFTGKLSTEQYRNSPFFRIDREGELHLPVGPSGSAQPYGIFNELAAVGHTDYFGTNLGDISGLRRRIAISTDVPGGFTNDQVEQLRLDLKYFSLVLSAVVESDMKFTIAKVFLGRDPGERVCKGMIVPGEVVGLDAAIWYSDLRGFTERAEALEADLLLSELNDYFRCVTGAIYDHGGEVLKYIGDAVLAIFPYDSLGGARAACVAALAAQLDHDEALEELNDERQAGGLPPFVDGVALHAGEVRYGNIGARERLDFTAIGRTINIAARVEGQCSVLGERVLCTREFADASQRPMRSSGEVKLKGISAPIEIGVPLSL